MNKVQRACRFLIAAPLLPILALIAWMHITDDLSAIPAVMVLLGLTLAAMAVDVAVDVVTEIWAYRQRRLMGLRKLSR